MELLKAIILGIIQGVTEFLPISSSGHLVIMSEFLDFQQQGVMFDVFLHLGTLFSVILVFRQELLAMVKAPFMLALGKADEQDRLFFTWDIYVVIATIPAVIVGLFLKDRVEYLFSNLNLVYAMLLLTAAIMICTKYLTVGELPLNWLRCLLVGCAQACAIMPGLSRSGSTIFTGMALGMDREIVAKFSFIMSIPAILGAVVLQSGELLGHTLSADALINLGAGTVMSALSGYFAIVLLLDIVRRNRLQYFGYYCLAVASIGFGHQLLG